MGIVFGVPAGAIGVLTINNTLRNGFLSGLFTGLGSSAADLFYSILTVFSVSIISDFLLKFSSEFGIAGALVLIIMGMLNFRKKEIKKSEDVSVKGLSKQFSISFLIAIMNPATILSFLVAFAAFNVSDNLSVQNGILLICGIITGTVFWWSGLSLLVVVFRRFITVKIYTVLNYLLGSLLVILGIIVIFNIFIA